MNQTRTTRALPATGRPHCLRTSAAAIRQTEAGLATAILGTVFTGIDVDTRPGLTPSEARAVFDEMSAPPFGLVGEPGLWVLPLGGGEFGPDAAATRAVREALDAVGIPHASGQMHTSNH